MTDFASQGRTRPYNPVDPEFCLTHQSLYTALSRSSTLSGTILLQPIDPKIVQGKLNRPLKQEFRELEILDDITKLRYLGKLPSNINANTRGQLIKQFLDWKGNNYIPSKTPSCLHWNDKDPLYPTSMPNRTTPWQYLDQTDDMNADIPSDPPLDHFVTAKGTVSLGTISNDRPNVANKKKRKRTVSTTRQGPDVHSWNATTWSCAYDSILTILRHIYVNNTMMWLSRWANMNE
ncbi:uncharacterized protein STEHIDRAFT_42304, partial [Stereum hirsutum FP-91666 SS1]|uniref:uncharacterized protein n=1 Tax=Stereum hirsutum (strain FP-91666) TaxID=721885 RepID=UPI000440F863